MFRALTTPVFSFSGVAGEALKNGNFVVETGKNAAGQSIYIKPTSAGTAANATQVAYLDPTIYNDPYNGVRDTIASGAPVQVISGCKFLCDAECLSGDFTATVAGAFLGITNSGLIAASGPASGTSKFVRFESFTGDATPNSGIFYGKLEAQI